MQLVKSTLYKKNKTAKTFCHSSFLLSIQNLIAQENSPYSRYGVGDLAYTMLLTVASGAFCRILRYTFHQL